MISIIIPAFNEAGIIGPLVKHLFEDCAPNLIEVIVSDGDSSDETVQIAKKAGANVVISPLKGRATQMNFGALVAKSPVLYFVHADTYPPKTFKADIEKAVKDGHEAGRYKTCFDSSMVLLKLNAFFTRFDWHICNGGDQTLFITRTLFNKIGGYNSTMLIMEDYDIVSRAKQFTRFKILQGNCLVSARKYETNSWLKVQLANKKIVDMYSKGASQNEMIQQYRQMLVYR